MQQRRFAELASVTPWFQPDKARFSMLAVAEALWSLTLCDGRQMLRPMLING